MADLTAGHSEQVRHLFDEKAATWPTKYAPDGRLASRLTSLAAVLHRHVRPDGRLLDLGCGTGELARGAAASGMRVTACDISAAMLRRAADGDSRGAVRWVLLDPGWQTLPFDQGSFDGVIAASVLEYLDEPSAVLSECARVLRPAGLMVCTVPSTLHPVRWLEWLARMAARCDALNALARHCPRLNGYLIYLRISRQRHTARWWREAAARAGLGTLSRQAGAWDRLPLTMFIFQRSGEPGETPQ